MVSSERMSCVPFATHSNQHFAISTSQPINYFRYLFVYYPKDNNEINLNNNICNTWTAS